MLDTIDGAPLDQAQRALLKKMQKAVHRVANETGIAEELLARKKILIRILRLNERTPDSELIRWPDDVHPWQRALLQKPIALTLGVKSDV